MSTLSVSIDRTALSLAALVAADDGTTFRISEDGFKRPAKTWRLEQMPDSADVHGTEYVAATLEQSSLPLQLLVQGTSASNLETKLDELEAAVGQFAYEVTTSIRGVTRTWSCGPGDFASSIDSGQSAAFLAVVNLTIPVYPVPEA